MKKLDLYLRNNTSWSLVIGFFIIQLLIRGLISLVLLFLIEDLIEIPFFWLWGRVVIHFIVLYPLALFVQKHKKKTKINLKNLFLLFLFVDFILHFLVGLPYLSVILFSYYLVKDKEIKVKRSYYLYYFILTIILISIETFFSDTGLPVEYLNEPINEPIIEDFLTISGIISLVLYFRNKPKKEKIENRIKG